MIDAAVQWLHNWDHLNAGSAAALAVIFFGAAFVLIPRTFLCLAVGAIFGPPAIAIILPSTTLGGVLAFLLSRYVLADRLQREVDKRPQLRAVADAFDSEGWRVVALLRFGAPIPNAVQNYLFGITRIGLWAFTAATFVFTIPQVVLYVYIGAAGREAILDDTSSILSRVLLGIGVLTLATVALLIARKSRAALRRISEPNG